jgi:hypothetical protein
MTPEELLNEQKREFGRLDLEVERLYYNVYGYPSPHEAEA